MLGYKAKGIKVADWVKAARQITLIEQARECHLDYATGGPNVITGSLKVEEEGHREGCKVAGFEDAIKWDWKLRTTRGFQKLEKARKWTFPYNLHKDRQCCCPFDFSPVKHLQDCEIINLCCFKPLNLW